jgi:hypothetical protein
MVIQISPDMFTYTWPSAEDKHRWEKLAEDAGVRLSQFVIQAAEDSLAEVEFRSRETIIGNN